jgi:hypothetical protein
MSDGENDNFSGEISIDDAERKLPEDVFSEISKVEGQRWGAALIARPPAQKRFQSCLRQGRCDLYTSLTMSDILVPPGDEIAAAYLPRSSARPLR